ncbi:hypothetical protein SLA2020_412440 [Shorea laevis]
MVAGGLGKLSPAEKKDGKEGSGLGMGSNHSYPSFAEVLRSGSSATTLLTTKWHGDLTGKVCDVTENLLGTDHFDACQSPFAQDEVSFLFGGVVKVNGRILGKGMMKSLLWAWKGQLVKAKEEVDKAWQMVLEGLEVLGCYLGSGNGSSQVSDLCFSAVLVGAHNSVAYNRVFWRSAIWDFPVGIDIASGLPQDPVVDADLVGFAPLAFSSELVAFPSPVMVSLELECVGVHQPSPVGPAGVSSSALVVRDVCSLVTPLDWAL